MRVGRENNFRFPTRVIFWYTAEVQGLASEHVRAEVLAIADEVIEKGCRNAAIDDREMTLWVNNCRATPPRRWLLHPQKLPRHSFAAAAVKGQ